MNLLKSLVALGSFLVIALPAQASEKFWESFGDTNLNRIVQSALQNNGDYKALRSRIEQAEAQLTKSRARLYPMLSLSAVHNWMPYEPDPIMQFLPGAPTNNPETFTSGGVYLNARYALDAWGSAFQQSRSLNQQAQASKYDFENLKLNLVTRIVQSYYDVAFNKNALVLAETQIKAASEVLELTRQRFRAGEVPLLSVLQQEQAMAAAETMLPALNSALRQGVETLCVLSGTLESEIQISDSLALVGNPQPEPKLNSERPDLKAAYSRLQAARYGINASLWNNIPQVELSGRYGYNYVNVTEANWDETWLVGISVNLPIFSGFSDVASYQESRAAYNSAEASFLQVSQQALADQKINQQKELDQYVAYQAHLKHLKAAERAYHEARVQYSNGLTTYLNVLSSLNAYTMSQNNELRARYTLLLSRLQSIQSRGGNL
jgi:outer membrane protein TolC